MFLHNPDDGDRKTFRNGTHRSVSPSTTLARIKPLMAAMGITRIANLTGLDDIGIPVVAVFRPNSRSVAVSQGKGLDLMAAKASGLMESVESFHAENITSPLKFASFNELKSDHALIDVTGLPRSVEGEFHEDHPILWIEGSDLISGDRLWLPHEMVSTDFTLPLQRGSGRFPANTNGLAAGNHALEAVLHGICEVVERDATALWWHRDDNEREARGVDLDTVDDTGCRDVIEKFERADIDVKVWETTTDVGIAAFLCVVAGCDNTNAFPEFGAGCHPCREVALLRALTEAAQVRTTFISGSRDDFPRRDYSDSAVVERLRQFRALMKGHSARRRFGDVPTWEVDTFHEDTTLALDHLQEAGITEVVVVDLTKKEFGVPVVRVVIPGLEGLFEGGGGDYVPGTRARAVAVGEK